MTTKLAAKFTTNRERGTSGVEYAGMLVVAAVIVGLLVAAFQGANLSGLISSAVAAVFG